MNNTFIAILVFGVAMVISGIVFPWALGYARKHNIVDNPNARKLQRRPVPVFGGVVVYAGMITGGLVLSLFIDSMVLIWSLISVTLLMAVGVWDDMRDISVKLRVGIELVLVWLFMAFTGIYINNFHGLWGIYELAPWVGILISTICGVGMINAINLIDGVDGYSSGYVMLACCCYALAFGSVWSVAMVCMALEVIGALIPFFMHNVFGQRTRMFMGDGGSLMLGMMMVVLIFYTLWDGSHMCLLKKEGLSLTGFVLAVGCMPIFDTLRVMVMRMLRGNSPFKPDKSHLHHLFIDMGFSHLGTALFILLINTLVVGIVLLAWHLGASIDTQTHMAIGLGILVTFVFYKVMRCQQNSGPLDEDGYPQGTALWHVMCQLGAQTHREHNRVWRALTHLVDVPLSARLKISHRRYRMKLNC